MVHLLWAPPLLGFAGFLVLALAGSRLRPAAVATIGVGAVGLAAAASVALTAALLRGPGADGALRAAAWDWIRVQGFDATLGLRLDALSAVMILVVTGVGLLIHLYAAEFMRGDEGYSRFFAYTNLFVGAMLTLVLADNLLLLYLGWEGVGLCSYLLIGFWYREPENGRAARKAFIVTRVGDTAMAIGLFVLATRLGTLDLETLPARAAAAWPVGSGPALLAAALLLGGALGKSAQLPLQVWLPDAMAGPTPVSALIHAATMVTAGVYLIARTHALFALAPPIQLAVAVIGAATLLVAGASALVQHDIKRILAYSTISQIGYMFLGLGVGGWSAGIFHLATHAAFKALLFLAAGAVILQLHHEHDIFRMGGLWRRSPLVFGTFLAGAASLTGVPLVTAGFYSKDWILWETWAGGHTLLWAAGLAGVLLTALYTFRLVFVVFFGPVRTEPHGRLGLRMQIPLVLLALGALGLGFLEVPASLGHVRVFSTFLRGALPAPPAGEGPGDELLLQTLAALAVLIGFLAALALYGGQQRRAARLSALPALQPIRALWFADWGFDWLYERLLVRPVRWFARRNQADAVDLVYQHLAGLSLAANRRLTRLQSGGVRRYAGAIAAGAALLLGIGLFR